MRLRACISGALLGATACAHLPERVRIDVDGRTIEIGPRGPSTTDLAGAWSRSPDCDGIPPEEVEVIGAAGTILRLYRCPR